MPKYFLFDAGFQVPSGPGFLTFSFERDYATVDPRGQAVAVDVERYWHSKRLLCGAPLITEEIAPNTNSHWICGGGVDVDGITPLLVYQSPPGEFIEIHRNGYSGSPIKTTNYGCGTNRADPKCGQLDLLIDQSNKDADLIHRFHDTVSVCHGLVVAFCEVRKNRVPDPNNPGNTMSLNVGFTGGVSSSTGTAGETRITATGVGGIDLRWGDVFYMTVPSSTNAYRIKRVEASPAAIIIERAFGSVETGLEGVIPQWKPVSTCVCTWQQSTTNPQDTEWQVLYADPDEIVSETVNPGQPRGSGFAAPGFRILDADEPLRAWFAGSSYTHNKLEFGGTTYFSDAATTYVFVANRASTSLPWTFEALTNVHSVTGVSGTHCHSPFVERYTSEVDGVEAGIRVVCPIGDVRERNRVIALYRADESYTDGQASSTADALQNGWRTREDRHGSHGFTGLPGEGNQFVGSAPVGTPENSLGNLIGCDEGTIPLTILAPPNGIDSTERFNFTRVWGQHHASVLPLSGFPASLANIRYNVFYATCADPWTGGPIAAWVGPAANPLTVASSRIVYSPVGLTYGSCFGPNQGTFPFAITNGRIYLGTQSGNDWGLRSFELPVTTVQRPLVIGGGGTNLLVENLSLPSPFGNNELEDMSPTEITNLGVPLPPTLGPVARCRAVDDDRLGLWSLTGSGAVATGNVKFRAFVYILPWTPTRNLASMAVFDLSIGDFAATNPIQDSRYRIAFDGMVCSGGNYQGWLPITMDTNTDDWTNDAHQPPLTLPTAPFTLGVRLTTGPAGLTTSALRPIEFLVAFDGVHAGGSGGVEHPGVPIEPGGASCGPEQASVLGMDCEENWTIQLAAEVPEDAWDSTVSTIGRLGTGVMCTLYDSEDLWIEVVADVDNDAVVFRFPNSHSVTVKPPPTSPERFFFSRATPVLLAVSRSSEGGVATYTCFASVGPSSVFLDSVQISDGDFGIISPVEIRLGDRELLTPEPMLWYGGAVHEDEALADGDVIDSFRSLGMLYAQYSESLP